MSQPHPPATEDLLALALVPGLGPRLTAALLNRFGSAAAIRRLTAEQLQQAPHIGEHLARQFAEALRSADLQEEMQLIERHRVKLLALGQPEYPPALAGIPDPPHLLYYRGTWTEADHRAIGIVGSRRCSSYGR